MYGVLVEETLLKHEENMQYPHGKARQIGYLCTDRPGESMTR